MSERLQCQLTRKSAMKAADNEAGTFEALVSVWATIDSYDEVVAPGAFANTLQDRGLPPVVWNHSQEPPIGAIESAQETDEGLTVKGRLFVEDNPLSRQVWRAMVERDGNGAHVLSDWSFSGVATDWGWREIDERQVRELREIELWEVGPVLVGANPDAKLQSVKSCAAAADEKEPNKQPAGLWVPLPAPRH